MASCSRPSFLSSSFLACRCSGVSIAFITLAVSLFTSSLNLEASSSSPALFSVEIRPLVVLSDFRMSSTSFNRLEVFMIFFWAFSAVRMFLAFGVPSPSEKTTGEAFISPNSACLVPLVEGFVPSSSDSEDYVLASIYSLDHSLVFCLFTAVETSILLNQKLLIENVIT